MPRAIIIDNPNLLPHRIKHNSCEVVVCAIPYGISGNVNIASLIHLDCNRKVVDRKTFVWSSVAMLPQFIAVGIVLNSGYFPRQTSITVTTHIDIPKSVQIQCCCPIPTIRWPILTGHPKRVSKRIVLDGYVVNLCNSILAATCDYNVARRIKLYSCWSIILTFRPKTKKPDPLLLSK